jgi:RNA polymerase sigma factor (sigma-70 family)
MRADSSDIDDVAFRHVCQQTIRMLIEKHGWLLLGEDDLLDLLLRSPQSPGSPADLERLVKGHYIRALYEACRQTADPERCEQGYRELSRYLYRAASNRWPDMAEDITQQALLLVYQQIDRCHEPTTFLAFALNKLRGVVSQNRRFASPGSSWEEAQQVADPDLVASDETQQEKQEQLEVLLDAIQRLPNKQQQPIILKFFEGLSDEEISKRLGLTVSNVRVLRHRALLQLREDEPLRAYFGQEQT